MAKKVFMSFDFETGKATLTGMTDEPIIKNIEELPKNEDMWNIYYFNFSISDFRFNIYLFNILFL